jgi:hypothetical protein
VGCAEGFYLCCLRRVRPNCAPLQQEFSRVRR